MVAKQEVPNTWPFTGDSQMAARMRGHDWPATPLGPPTQWPQSLKLAVSMLLECKLPMYLAWGDQFIQFFNDAYLPILGDKDADALGNSAPVTWPEIWPTIGPMWQQVLAGQAIGFDDYKLTIERFGYPEDCYFNFSYSAARDDHGRAAGVLVTFAETTRFVLAEQRWRFLDQLSQAVRGISQPSEVLRVTSEMLGRHLGVNRCAYAHVHDDQNTFDLIGDYNDGVDSIVGRYRFTDFGEAVHSLMCRNEPFVNDDVDRSPMTAGADLSAYRATRIQSVICVPLHKNGRFVAAMAVHQAISRHWTKEEVELVQQVVDRCWESLERLRVETALREEARSLEVLNQTGEALSAELKLDALLQHVTDAATELTGARFGAFFYNGVDQQGEAYLLYTLSGAPREAFANLGQPRATTLFGHTFFGKPVIRLDDVLADARYGQWAPHHGMPKGHLPVRSYLAAPVISRNGEVIGGLFFGHPEVGVFTERSEKIAVGIASQAAVAIDNARLYASAQQAAQERNILLDGERAARQEAERASAVKDEFLATLSHELRTPLGAITGWAHILRRSLDGARPDLLKGIDVIDRSTKMQVQLIDDLLDMSRITSGKLALGMQPVSPVDFVQSALDVIKPSADKAGIQLVTELAAVPPVMGDAGRLQQVVWNLLANAVKFTPRGGVVHVTLGSDEHDAIIEVTDTGVGVDPDFLPKIFERFRQADSSITRKFGGLGLGLSIVHHLVELHGGAASAHSQGADKGAAFTVRLPLMHAGALQGEGLIRSPVPDPVLDASDLSQLDGVRVLIVDDDDNVREVLGRAMQDCGVQVHLSSSADDALRVLPGFKPNVLISDIGMPGTDGYELMRRIKRLPVESGLRVPAIAVTAFARPEDRARALEAGYALHLPKPIEPVRILMEVARLLRKGDL